MITQQRVELKFGTGEHKAGTVSKVYWNGSFKVSYDSYLDGKGHRVSGGRYVYSASQAGSFTVVS